MDDEERDDALRDVFRMAHNLLDALQVNDTGHMGRGGDGGLLTRDTMRIADKLRQALYRFKDSPNVGTNHPPA